MHTLSTTMGTVLALILPKLASSIIVVILFFGFGIYLLVTTCKQQKCFTKDPITGRRTRDVDSEDEFEATKKEVEEHDAEVAALKKLEAEKKSKTIENKPKENPPSTTDNKDAKEGGENDEPTNQEGDKN